MKVVVIGNCQSRPLRELLVKHGGLEALPEIILHKAQPQDKDAAESFIAAADVIVAQATANPFRLPWLTSDALRKRFLGKVVVWPNVFHLADQPFLRLVTRQGLGPVHGPFEAYHDLRLIRAWHCEALGMNWRPEIDEPDFASGAVRRSQASLVARERSCDVRVSDLIEREAGRRPLFFLFNHPTAWLLARLAERVLERLGCSVCIDGSKEPERLGRVVVPSTWTLLDQAAHPFRGFDIELLPQGGTRLGPARTFGAEEARARAFAVYAHVFGDRPANDVLLTPAM